jgi:hypothetical protein
MRVILLFYYKKINSRKWEYTNKTVSYNTLLGNAGSQFRE